MNLSIFKFINAPLYHTIFPTMGKSTLTIHPSTRASRSAKTKRSSSAISQAELYPGNESESDEELGTMSVVNPLTIVHNKEFEEIDLGDSSMDEEKTDFTIIRNMLPKISDILSSKTSSTMTCNLKSSGSLDLSESSIDSLGIPEGSECSELRGVDYTGKTKVIDTNDFSSQCVYTSIGLFIGIFFSTIIWMLLL